MEDHERRKHTRVDFCNRADLVFAETSCSARPTKNLSTKGVFVENVHNRILGEQCSITLHLTGSIESFSLCMQGVVARVTDNGIGLYFTDIDLEAFTLLRRIITYNCDDPDQQEENFLGH